MVRAWKCRPAPQEILDKGEVTSKTALEQIVSVLIEKPQVAGERHQAQKILSAKM